MSSGGRSVRIKGFTLIEIMIVVAIFGVLLGFAIPAAMRAALTTRQNLCIESLRILDHAKEQLAWDQSLQAGAVIADVTDLDPYIKGGTANVSCPSDTNETFATSYQVNALGTDPACRIDPANHVL